MYINLRTVFALVQGITWIHPKKKIHSFICPPVTSLRSVSGIFTWLINSSKRWYWFFSVLWIFLNILLKKKSYRSVVSKCLTS